MEKPKFTYLAVIIFFLLSLSCTDDKSQSTANRWEALATIQPTGNNSHNLILDNGRILEVSNDTGNYTKEKKQRVYVNFTYLTDSTNLQSYPVKVNWKSNILTKDVVVFTGENEVGTDPVIINSIWFGDDYLNVYFEFKGDNKGTHSIDLGFNEQTVPANDGKIHLEFRHNANGTPEYYKRRSYAAFDFRPYKEEMEKNGSLSFSINYIDYNGEYIKREIIYSSNSQEQISLTYEDVIDTTLFR